MDIIAYTLYMSRIDLPLVVFFKRCEGTGPVPFTLRLKIDGKVKNYTGEVIYENEEIIMDTFSR